MHTREGVQCTRFSCWAEMHVHIKHFYCLLKCCHMLTRMRVLLLPLQAQVTQQANLMAGKRGAPVWALALIAFLGWNELVAVLWNPLYLIAGAIAFLLAYQLYAELDVDAEMQRGALVGLLNIWSRLGDVLRTVLARNLDMLRHLAGAVVDASSSGAAPQGESPMRSGRGSPGMARVVQQSHAPHPSVSGLKQRGVQMAELPRGAAGAGVDATVDSSKDE